MSQTVGTLYKHINSRLTHKVGIAPLLNQDGVLVLNDSEKAEILNKQFTLDDGFCPNIASSNPSQTSICDVKFDAVRVFKLIQKTKINNSSTGPDNILSVHLKNLKHQLCHPPAMFKCIFKLIICQRN